MRMRVRLHTRPGPAAMNGNKSPPSRTTLVLAMLATAGFGLYFSLIGLGVLPVPGGPKTLHGPLWIVLAAGVVFLLGGIAVALQDAAGADLDTGELPKDAARWVRVAQYLIGVTIFACFGLIGSWIAFGPGDRAFSGTVPVGTTLGRIMFGIGAVIVWLGLIAYAVSGARKLRKSE
jgi:hypothetical protein